MCGILVYKEKGDNSKIRLRGQDATNKVVVNGYTFIHNLLSVTGEFTLQPFIDGGVVCLYNGEIYNQKFKISDGECLIPLYKKYGERFASKLDGEFAIALYDFEKGIALFITDQFKTKPLFVNGTECASYRSGVGGEKMKPNTTRVVNLKTGELKEFENFIWDFNQHKTTYNDWILAFENSVKKRAKKDCFLGLSSGYDSGAITCELLKNNIQFKAYTYEGKEDKEILEKRKTNLNLEIFEPDYSLMKWLKENTDNEPYTIKYKSGLQFSFHTEGGTLGVATICKLASSEGRKVCLSSQGADEIMSDYQFFPDQSELLGVFPDKLKLWNNFYFGCQESYLIKEEYAGGAFNIETRYPFLDRQVVQEFLWLTPELKNKHYKAPLREYLIRNNYPFKENEKIGFGINL